MRHLWRLIKLLRPFMLTMLLGIFISLITILANISLLAVSGWFITAMALAGLSGASINYFTPAAIIRFLAIVRTVGRYGERMLTHRATFSALARLRFYFYQKLEPLLPYYQQSLRSGDVLARLQSDIDTLDNFYLRVLLPSCVALFGVPIICVALSFISVTLAWTMLLAYMLVGILLPAVTYQLAKQSAITKNQLENKLTLELVDGFSAMRELLVFGKATQYIKMINSLSNRYHQVQVRLSQINNLSNAVIFVIINLSLVLTLIILVPNLNITSDFILESHILQGKVLLEKVLFESLSGSELASATLLILVSFEMVIALPLAMMHLPLTAASVARLFDIIDRKPPVRHGELAVEGGNGKIVFNNFNFRYPQDKKNTLHNISFSISPGEKVAIIGSSGAGKSTLVNSLMGFWPIAKDQLCINNIDLNNLSATSLRQHIALMSQQGHLFHATINDNLRLANDHATPQEIKTACDKAGILSVIESLENGFDTWIGESATGLSGGEKQRLQLAQLFLRDAKLLILDEPSKGLDIVNEQRLLDNLLRHANDKQQSILLITHRPLMLKAMDKILIMQQGEIIAQGNHQQLLSNNKYYQQLLNYF
ncbi:MAG: thiol reductant ABC exporter subunit CydC [Psychrobium sp.]|nr:thiol reductant ABC exporter subunit CydC [Psychrobium sp.]